MKRGISPAIATLLLMGVAVIGGISAGTTMFKQNDIVSKSTRIDIIKTNLVDMQIANKTFFTINLKNTGTTPISYGSVGFYDNYNVFNSVAIPKLDPGQAFGVSQVFDASVSLNKKYQLHARVLATDGSTYDWTDLQTAAG